MRAGILAAGHGARLRAAGIATPKALVRVAGRPLVRHALDAVVAAGALEAWVAANEDDAEAVERALRAGSPPIPLHFVRRSTSSSLETFALLAPRLAQAGSHALVAMVDGIFEVEALRGFGREASAMARAGSDAAEEGLIGVTDRSDDDRPLRVAFDTNLRIRAVGPGAGASRFATAGLYLLPRRAFALAPEALRSGMGALRAFLVDLVERGLRLRAHPLGTVVDVDRIDDLRAAEQLARGA